MPVHARCAVCYLSALSPTLSLSLSLSLAEFSALGISPLLRNPEVPPRLMKKPRFESSRTLETLMSSL